MYEYLENIGVVFYDKNVYFYNPFSKDYNYREKAYRVAFLTKEEIESLKGGEDYGILVEIVCEELAKMDNEPVYLDAIIIRNAWKSLDKLLDNPIYNMKVEVIMKLLKKALSLFMVVVISLCSYAPIAWPWVIKLFHLLMPHKLCIGYL